MAKFTGGDLRLKDGQKVTLGTSLDSNLWWDGSANDLRLDTTISGINPTQDYHLTTKYYVDDEIATLSGSIILDHGNLTGLLDDDHTQYVPTNASRGFTATVSGIDPTQSYHLTTKSYVDTAVGVSGAIDHGNLNGLGDDDHTQYILVDGTRAFTGVVGGITPTSTAHLTTKGYVDGLVQGLDWKESVIKFAPVASGVQSAGNRYIASATGGGWTKDQIYEWDGSQWANDPVNEGAATWVEDEDIVYTYNGAAWVKFGSTVTHNNLNGLQGGTAGEYYHLTNTDYTWLTTNRTENIQDLVGAMVSSNTETNITVTYQDGDGTLDFVVPVATSAVLGVASFDSNDFTVTAGDVVIAAGGVDNAQLANSSLTVTAGSGLINGGAVSLGGSTTLDVNVDGTTITIVSDVLQANAGSLDHGSLLGLADDDHLQYVPRDGSRGFTATVSGVTPTQDYHLATKSYVDAGGMDRHGRQAVANGASTVTVNFADLGHTDYTINATLENLVDSPPSIYAFIVSGVTSSSFTVTFMGDMDSVNYKLNWSVIED